jgi:hypothetical protein
MPKRSKEEKDQVKSLLKQIMPDEYPQSFADYLVDEFYDIVMDDIEGKSTGNPELDKILVRLGGKVSGV